MLWLLISGALFYFVFRWFLVGWKYLDFLGWRKYEAL